MISRKQKWGQSPILAGMILAGLGEFLSKETS
jgi:hypothetical protein